MPKRVPSGIALGTDGFEHSVYALADDDTIWFFDRARTNAWQQIPSPPAIPKLIDARGAMPHALCVLCVDDVIYVYHAEDNKWEVIPPLP